MLKKIIAILVVILAAAQLYPIDRDNPPVTAEIPAPENVMTVLENSCYDCHSNETVWPWYSRVAPVSWLVASDVHEARHHMNFTEWNKYSEKKAAEHIEEIWEEVGEGEMPLWYYLPLHPDARLTEADRMTLKNWSESGGG